MFSIVKIQILIFINDRQLILERNFFLKKINQVLLFNKILIDNFLE